MRKLLRIACVFSITSVSLGQSDSASFAAALTRYEVHPNLVYHIANNYENKLDVAQTHRYFAADASCRGNPRRWLG